MDLGIIAAGVLLGLSIAAPVGPIGVLCIRRTLSDGRLVGLVTGLGAATADATYAGVGAFGLALVSETLVREEVWFRLIGGVLLAYLGVKTFFARPVTDVREAHPHSGLFAAYATTVLLTLSNPATILSFAAIFAGLLPPTRGRTFTASLLLVAGVFLGSALWWLILSGVVGVIRGRMYGPRLRLVNRGSGLILLGFSAVVLGSLFVRIFA